MWTRLSNSNFINIEEPDIHIVPRFRYTTPRSLTIRQVFHFPQATLPLQQLQLPLHLDPMKLGLAKRELFLAQRLNPLKVRVPSQTVPCELRFRRNCPQG